MPLSSFAHHASCGVDCSSFRSLAEYFAPASRVLSRHDDSWLQKLHLVGCSFMRKQAIAFCAAASTRPVMMIYGGDLTPMLMKFRQTTVVAGSRIVRVGGRACEWCVHRCYFMWHDDHNVLRVRTAFEAPVLMASKQTWHAYACAERLAPLLRSRHQTGINISWYVFDRGARAPMVRLLRRRHAMALRKIENPHGAHHGRPV